uniref:MATH domain and coiled-coil domain-containing protein n=1 Tax=Noccaea caerulescens TaxID=107243 RepID=A0A1J3FSB4_NOCCA
MRKTELTELTEAGFKLDCLKSKLEEVFLERKKALSDRSWIQQLEERLKKTELTLSDLKAELDKEKIKSAAAAKVSSFQFIDYLLRRFFLSCFSIS